MMKSGWIFGIILWALVPNLAWADTCDTPKTQAEMTYCADWWFKKNDAAMSDAYSRLRTYYAKIPSAKAGLLKAQRTWLAFRDAECALEALGETGGTARPMIYNQCLSGLTQLRAEQLQRRLDCQEGDLTCIAAGDAAN